MTTQYHKHTLPLLENQKKSWYIDYCLQKSVEIVFPLICFHLIFLDETAVVGCIWYLGKFIWSPPRGARLILIFAEGEKEDWKKYYAEYQKYFQDAANKGLLELSVTTANESNPKWNLCNMVCCAIIMIYVSFRISWYFGDMDRLHAQIPLYPNYWS